MHLFRRADELDEDLLHGFLVGLKMLSEMMADLPAGHPGCLVAAYCYRIVFLTGRYETSTHPPCRCPHSGWTEKHLLVVSISGF